MTLEPKASLEKQPDWIDNFIKEADRISDAIAMDRTPEDLVKLKELLITFLPQEDDYQKTTVPNVLLYETGYKQGREDMKEEIEETIGSISTTKIMLEWHWLQYSNGYNDWYKKVLEVLFNK